MKNYFLRCFIFTALLLIPWSVNWAQVVVGVPPYGSYGGGPDVINLANLNAHFGFPILHKPGRGLPFNFDLSYDTSIWSPVVSGSTTTWQPVTNWGWGGSELQVGYVRFKLTSTSGPACGRGGSVVHDTWSDWVYYDGTGTPHPFAGISHGTYPSCSSPTLTSFDVTALDGSGYDLSVTGGHINQLTTRDGAIITRAPSAGAPGSVRDRNGNTISDDGHNNFTDTLGSSVLTSAGSAPSTVTYTFANSSGSPNSVSISYVNYAIQTAFGCSGIVEYANASVSLVDRLTLPNGTFYQFSYENTPGSTTTVTGRLKSVTLPTGESITYNYTGGSTGHITCTDGSTAGLTRVIPDGTWTYSRVLGTGAASTTTVTDPQNNQTVLQFQGIYATQRQVYQGLASTGTLLETTSTCYNGITTSCGTTAVTLPISATATISQHDAAGPANKIVSTYNAAGEPLEVDAYGYATTGVGSLLRKTIYTYAPLGNITSYRQTITVTDASGSVLSKTNYNYDETAPVTVSGVPQNVSVSSARGNLTSVQLCLAIPSCSNYLTTKTVYDTTGQTLNFTDSAGNVTSFGYSDKFYVDNASSPTNPALPYTSPSPTNAFLTSVSVPVIGASGTLGYYFYSGKSASFQDANGAVTYSHYDAFDRPSLSYLPALPNGNRGWMLNQYPSATQIDSYSGISSTSASSGCSGCRHQQLSLDSSGRVSSDVLQNDPEGLTKMTTTYDSVGRLANISNPFRTTSDPTYGIQSLTYDNLGRLTKTVYADGSATQQVYGPNVGASGGAASQLCVTTTYGVGYPTLTLDAKGKKHQEWTDGLGRLIEVDEPDSAANLTVGSCYSYDLLNNLKTVTQGTITRSYSYDSISRLTSSTTPEAGSQTFFYTTSGGGLCSGSPKQICRRTDARGIVATNTYDALNRLTSTNYSDGTPQVTYFYDQVTYNGLAITNGKNRLTGMSDGSGVSARSYNGLGQIVAEQRTIAGVTKSIMYTYNLDGSLATVTYPSGREVDYSYSNAQRVVSVMDAGSGVNYASQILYAPHGEPTNVLYGHTGSYAGLTEVDSYNNRLQALSVQVNAASSAAVMNISYGFTSSPNNNGLNTSVANNIVPGRSENIQYDSLNRISSVSTQATTGANCWGLGYSYDQWGNLLSSTVTQCSATSLSLSVSNNRITNTGFSYDAAGHMTNDGSNSYTYDAEGRIKAGGGVTYTYDGSGMRVAKSNGTLYWRTFTGDVLQESDLAGNISNSYVFLRGRRIARIDSSNNVFYYFTDEQRSTRVMTQSNGTVCADSDYYTFGGELPVVNTCPQNYKFAGMEHDPETGLDYSLFRYYNNRLARFMTPDPLTGSLASPQSLNRYSYALNNPCAFTDPLGLTPACTINIAIGGPGVSLDEIVRIFAQANVGVNFNTTPETTDYFLSAVDTTQIYSPGFKFAMNSLGSTACLGCNYGYVYTDRVMAWLSAGKQDVNLLSMSMGAIGAHEIMHGLGLQDVGGADNIMGPGLHLSPESRTLTPEQKKRILAACQALRSGTPLKTKADSTNSLGDVAVWIEAVLGPDPEGTVSTQEVDNLPSACSTMDCTIVPPSAIDPSSGDPNSGDPGEGDPGYGDPDPGAGDPSSGDPGSGDPGTGDPGSDGPDEKGLVVATYDTVPQYRNLIGVDL